MMRRIRSACAAAVMAGLIGLAGVVGVAQAQTAGGGAATQAGAAADLTTPVNCLESYLKARQAINFAGMKACILPGDATQNKLVDVILTYESWQAYLEKAAIAKFGPEKGLTILSHDRPMTDVAASQLKRAHLSTPDIDPAEKTTATIRLRPDKDAPPDEKDRPFHLKQVGGEWKLDFIKSRGLDDPEQKEQINAYLNSYPAVSAAMRSLTDRIKKGTVTSAEEAKNELMRAWEGAAGGGDAGDAGGAAGGTTGGDAAGGNAGTGNTDGAEPK